MHLNQPGAAPRHNHSIATLGRTVPPASVPGLPLSRQELQRLVAAMVD